MASHREHSQWEAMFLFYASREISYLSKYEAAYKP